MKKIKRFIILAVSAIVMFAAVPPIASFAKSSAQLKKEKEQMEKNIKDMKAALEDVREKQETIAAEIIELDIKVAEAQYELDIVTDELNEITERLEESEAQLAQAIIDRDEQEELFKKRIKFVHENGYSGYIEIILESENITDLFIRTQYINDIMEYDKNTLTMLQETMELIDRKTKEIAEDKAEQEIVVAEYQKRKDEWDKALAEKQAAAEQYELDEANYIQSIADWEDASKNIETLIKEAQEAEARAAAEAAKKQSSSSSGTYTYSGGKFSWPVPGYSRISSEYGYRDGIFVSGREFHTGLDIPAAYGSNIVSAADGKVITSGYIRGYGYTVMVSHGDGLVTLYGHNSSLAVSVGDWISAGDVIAYAGSTGNSTGNHCHFEVRLNGSHTNPWSYL